MDALTKVRIFLLFLYFPQIDSDDDVKNGDETSSMNGTKKVQGKANIVVVNNKPGKRKNDDTGKKINGEDESVQKKFAPFLDKSEITITVKKPADEKNASAI